MAEDAGVGVAGDVGAPLATGGVRRARTNVASLESLEISLLTESVGHCVCVVVVSGVSGVSGGGVGGIGGSVGWWASGR